MRVQGQSHGTGDGAGDGSGDGQRSQASSGARDGAAVPPPPAGAKPQPAGAANAKPAAGGTDVRDAEAAPGPGELTGPLPVVAPTGRRNGQTRATLAAPAEITQTNPLRRTRVIVRRLGPLSVFRFTLLYSFSVMLVVYLALVILYSVLGALGILDSVAKTIVEFGGSKGFRFNGGWIFSRLFFLGVALVFLWSVLKVIASLIYNLVSNIVGGIEVTLAERR